VFRVTDSGAGYEGRKLVGIPRPIAVLDSMVSLCAREPQGGIDFCIARKQGSGRGS